MERGGEGKRERRRKGRRGGGEGEERDIALATDIIHNNYKFNHMVWRQLAHTYIRTYVCSSHHQLNQA